LINVIKCVIENVPFMCHEPHRKGDYCSGWAMLVLAEVYPKPVKVP